MILMATSQVTTLIGTLLCRLADKNGFRQLLNHAKTIFCIYSNKVIKYTVHGQHKIYTVLTIQSSLCRISYNKCQ